MIFADFSQRYPGFHKEIYYKKVVLEKFATYSQTDGVIKRVKLFADYAWSIPLITYVVFINFSYPKIYTYSVFYI